MTFSVKAALDAYVATTGKVWEHDRLASIGASEIGQCSRKVWYVKNEIPQDEGYVERWGPRVRGTLYEDTLFVPAMRMLDSGYTAHWTGDDQKTISSGFLSATPDSLVTGNDECFLVEAKSIDPRVDLRKARDAHTYQVIVQMGLVREFTNHQPTHAIIAYLDASFPDDVTEFRVEFSQMVYDAAVHRAREIMGAGDALELRPEGVIAGGAECDFCPFRRRCRGDERDAHPKEKAPLDEADEAILARLIDEFDSLREDEELTERLLGSTKERIKELLRSAGTRWAKVDGLDGSVHSVNWQSRKGRLSLDQEAMTADGIDLAKYQTEGDPYDVLVIIK